MTLPTIGYVNAPRFFAIKFPLQRYVTNKKGLICFNIISELLKNYKYG